MLNKRIYLVGGSVRDHILGIKSKDRDYVMEATFEEMKAFVLEKGYTVVHEKPEFVTLKVKIPSGEVVDFVCCRKEGDYDGRRPGSVEVTDLNSDLSRRDFTVNAMAWEVDSDTFEPIGEILDPFGGQRDLRYHELKFVGDPIKRLEEDGLRWLRAIRFWITKGLVPTGPTMYLIENPPEGLLDKVSSDRIKDELEKCFKYDVMLTMRILSKLHPIWIKDGIWLKPTLEKK